MVLSALGFLLGVAAFQQLPLLPSWYWCVPGLVVLLLFALRRSWLIPVAFSALGFCWSLLYAHLLLAHELPAALEGQDLIAQGTISALPTVSPQRTRFEFNINKLWKIENPPADWGALESQAVVRVNSGPNRVLLNWYAPPADLHVGQAWTLLIRLKRPHGYRNPGGFDYEAWLLHRGVRATGYVRDLKPAKSNAAVIDGIGGINVIRSDGPGSYWVHGARQWLQERIDFSLQDSPNRGIITALTIGQRDAITPEQWEVFTATGTNHLMAISGLHIGLIAGLAFFVVRRLWSRWTYVTLRLPAQKAAAIAAIICAAGYAALAGFAIPTQRALAMVVVVMLALLRQRNFQPLNVLSLALLLVLMLDPLAVLDNGFWLSFSAVGILVYGMAGRLAPSGLWWRWGRAQWLVFVGLAPLLLWGFQNIPLASPLANVVAIPWVSFTTVPLSLSAAVLFPFVPWAAQWLITLADWSLQGLWPLLQWLAQVPQPSWLAVKPPLWTLIPATVGILWLLAPRGMPARWVAIVWLTPMFLPSVDGPQTGAAEFTLLDVGQGLAAVIKTQSHVLVYDSGPRFSSDFDTGRAVVVPYLRSQGIQHIDRFIVSHGDNDHIGGAQSVLDAMPVDQVLTSVVQQFAPGQAQPCVSGNTWQWDGVRFTFLSPDADDYGREVHDNNLSCVLKVQTPSATLLLTGDIEKNVERELVLEAQEHSIAADILVVPHHGSKTSSSLPFIHRVSPAYALAAVGYRNRFGFPKPQVVERYLQNSRPGCVFLDTAENGAMRFMLHRDTGAELIQLYRKSARRYWHTDLTQWYSF